MLSVNEATMHIAHSFSRDAYVTTESKKDYGYL